jgi:hypothetical protein
MKFGMSPGTPTMARSPAGAFGRREKRIHIMIGRPRCAGIGTDTVLSAVRVATEDSPWEVVPQKYGAVLRAVVAAPGAARKPERVRLEIEP